MFPRYSRKYWVAALLALTMGFLGAHKVYNGEYIKATLYFLFSWTMLPWLISWVEGFLYLADAEGYDRRYNGNRLPPNRERFRGKVNPNFLPHKDED